MRQFHLFAFVSITLLLTANSVAQQTATTSVPDLIRYTGMVKAGPGATAVSSATLGITFSIYKQQDGGAPVWMETQNVTTDASGNYSVLLGSTTSTGLPSDLFLQQEERWLEVQVQGQSEQPRVLMVSVPYAFKAHEADTLGGKSVSDFVLANGANFAANGIDVVAMSPLPVSNPASSGTQAPAPAQGPISFSGSTADQIVAVVQSGTGTGVNARAAANAVIGTATGASGWGVFGMAAGEGGHGVVGESTNPAGVGVGVKGSSSSTSGTGVRGIEIATTGYTAGVSGYVASPSGTAAVFNNAAGGNIIRGQNNGVDTFSVAANGDVTSSGTLRGNGSGLTGLEFSQIAGQLRASQLDGTYASAVKLSNTANVYYGDGSHLTGTGGGGGSPHYIWNSASQQANANFNISGSGTANVFQANAFSSSTGYQIGGQSVLRVDDTQSLFLGEGAGAYNQSGGLRNNVFTGFQAGSGNTTGGDNTFTGAFAGTNNVSSSGNTFTGYGTGFNSNGGNNTFTGAGAGFMNTWGGNNAFYGAGTGSNNVDGSSNAFFGYQAGANNYGGAGNTFSGYAAGYSNQYANGNSFYGGQAGYSNTQGYGNIFVGSEAGYNNTTGNNDIYIGSLGPASGTESNAIRIGGDTENGAQTAAYIVGIYGSTSSSGIPVYIDSDGKLGTQTSSLRFKEQVRDMGDTTDALMQLRPVTFLYKPEYDNGERTLQYGLIAEEVARVYPELVAYDKDGQPHSVRYQYLSTMLLNEVQKQYRRAEEQSEIVATQQAQVKTQQQEIESLRQQLQLQNASLQERLSRLEKLVRVNTAEIAPNATGGAQ